MDNLEQLEQRFSELRGTLATLDVSIDNVEQSFIREEKCTGRWFQYLNRLNSLKKNRHICVSRMARLRLVIEQEKAIEEARKGA